MLSPVGAMRRAETGQGAFRKVGAIVGDDVLRYTVPDCDICDECHNSRTIQLLDWLRFNPLGEFVHGDKQMCHAAARRLEWAHHVQSPDGKGPGEGDGLECRSRQVLLGNEGLASFAAFDSLFSVFQSSRPEETVAEGFGHK